MGWCDVLFFIVPTFRVNCRRGRLGRSLADNPFSQVLAAEPTGEPQKPPYVDTSGGQRYPKPDPTFDRPATQPRQYLGLL